MTSRLQMSSAFNPQPCASGDRMGRGLSPHSALGAVTAWIPAAARGFTASSAATSVIVRSRLFRKYVGLFVAVVCVALLTNGLFEIWFSYRGAQGLADPHPARAGRGGRRQDRPVHQGDRRPARLDHAAGRGRRARRAAALRRAASAAPGAGHHRAGAARSTGTEQLRVSRLAMDVVGSDTDFSKDPKFTEARGEEGLLRPGLLPPRVRALHDARARRHAPRRRRERRRGQSQAHLGRGLADQGRRARARPTWSTRRAA